MVNQKILETVEEFLENAPCSDLSALRTPDPASSPSTARPRITEVVQGTKFLLQQSRERLVITCVPHLALGLRVLSLIIRSRGCSRVANVSSIDVSRYHLALLLLRAHFAAGRTTARDSPLASAGSRNMGRARRTSLPQVIYRSISGCHPLTSR